MAELMQNVELSKLLEMRGVDGYLLLDGNAEIVEAKIPEGIVLNEINNTVKSMIRAQKKLGTLESTLLLTEKGVVQISQITNYFLVIIAGYNLSVDVTRLASLVDEIKVSLVE